MNNVSMKKALRKELRTKRRSLTAAEHALRSRRAASFVVRSATFKTGSRVAVYLPFDREVATAALISRAKRRNIRLFVPVVSDRRHRRLRFYPLSEKTSRGAFGISIPHGVARGALRCGGWVSPRWFDLIVVPLVGVDGDGRRLGFGGGFYDRALAFRRWRRVWKGPRLIGFGFECQCADTVYAQPWDLRLDSLATESSLIHYRRGIE